VGKMNKEEKKKKRIRRLSPLLTFSQNKNNIQRKIKVPHT
jgi:hypothetical protein